MRSIQCAIQPPPHSSTAHLQRRGAVRARRAYTRFDERHVLIDEEDHRVVRARRHQVDHPLAHALDVVQAGAVQAERDARAPASASYIGSKCGDQSGTPSTGFGRMTPATQPHGRDAVRPRAPRPPGSCGGITAVPTRRSGAADTQSAIQSFHTWWRRDREVDVVDAAEGLAEPAVEHRDVDALFVEHLERVPSASKPAGLRSSVAHRVAEVLVVVHARVAEAGEPHRDADVVLDQHLLGPSSSLQRTRRPALAHRRRQVALPEVGRLADVPVGVDRRPCARCSWSQQFPPNRRRSSLIMAHGSGPRPRGNLIGCESRLRERVVSWGGRSPGHWSTRVTTSSRCRVAGPAPWWRDARRRRRR